MSWHFADRCRGDSADEEQSDESHSDEREERVAREVNVLALIKGEEHYVFVYDEQSLASLLRHFHQQALDEEVSLTWFDAAVLTEKAWEQTGANRRIPN